MFCRFSEVRGALVRGELPKEADRLVTITSVGSSDRPGCCPSFLSSRWRGLPYTLPLIADRPLGT